MNGLLLTTQSESKDIKTNVKNFLNNREDIDQKEMNFFQKNLEELLKEMPDEKNKSFLISKILDLPTNTSKKIKTTSNFSNEELTKDQSEKITLQELTAFVSFLKDNNTNKNIDFTTKNSELKAIISDQEIINEFKNAKNINDLLKVAQKNGIEVKNFQFFSTQKALDTDAKEMIKKIKSEDIFNLINKQTSSTSQKSDHHINNFENHKEQKSSKNLLQNILSSQSINSSKKTQITQTQVTQSNKNDIQDKEKNPLQATINDNPPIKKEQQSDERQTLKKQKIQPESIQSAKNLNLSKHTKIDQTIITNGKISNQSLEDNPTQIPQLKKSNTIDQTQLKSQTVLVHTQTNPQTLQKEQTLSIKQEMQNQSIKDELTQIPSHIKSNTIDQTQLKSQTVPVHTQTNPQTLQKEQTLSIKQEMQNQSIKDESTQIPSHTKTKILQNEYSINKNSPEIFKNTIIQDKEQITLVEHNSSTQKKDFTKELSSQANTQITDKAKSNVLKEKKLDDTPLLKKENQTFSSINHDGEASKASQHKIVENKTLQTILTKQETQNTIQKNQIQNTEYINEKVEETNRTDSSTSDKHAVSTEQKSTPVQHHKNEHHDFKKTFNSFAQEFKEKVESYKPPLMKIKMQLNPGNLGEVDVTLINRGNNLQVNINSNPATIAIFTQNQTEFKNSLVNMGFSSLQMNFGDNKDGQRGQNHKENSKNTRFFEEDQEKDGFEIIVPRYI